MAIETRAYQFSSNPKHADNVLLKKSFAFAVSIINYCQELDALKSYTISKQLSRSGTSIGANSREAQNAESRADFIHKLKIALKEAEETEYWLFLCSEIKGLPKTEDLLEQISQLIRLLNKIISTSKNNREK